MSVLKAPTTVTAPGFPQRPAAAGVEDSTVRRGRTRLARSARPALARGERVVVSELDDSGRTVVATLHGLYRSAVGDDPQNWTRWGWETVHRVDWVAARRVLTVHALAAPAYGPAVLRLPDGARLAAFAAERVAAGTLLDTHVVLADGRVARVIARCRPGAADPVWIVVLPGAGNGVPADPRTDGLVTAAIGRLRRSHGL